MTEPKELYIREDYEALEDGFDMQDNGHDPDSLDLDGDRPVWSDKPSFYDGHLADSHTFYMERYGQKL